MIGVEFVDAAGDADSRLCASLIRGVSGKGIDH